jgi:hypothetical protein
VPTPSPSPSQTPAPTSAPTRAPAQSPAQQTVVAETLTQQVNLVTTFLTLLVKEESQQQQLLTQTVADNKVRTKRQGIEVSGETCN